LNWIAQNNPPKMRLHLISVLLAFGYAHAELGRFNEHRELTPRDVGAYHTDAFEKLGQIYRSNKPKSKLDTMINISNILSSYCGVGDHRCKANAHKTTLEQFYAAEQKRAETIYPSNFDETAQKSMELVLAIVRDVNENNFEESVMSLSQIREDLENMEDGNGHLAGAIATASIAIESTTLWHGVLTNPEHNLHETVTNTLELGRNGDRRTQLFVVDSAKIIEADVTATVAAFVSSDPKNYFDIVNLDGPKKIYEEMVLAAVAASAAAAVDSTQSDFIAP